MKLLLGALMALLAALLSAAPALAGTQDQARVALHLKEHTTKTSTACTTWSPAGEGRPCGQFVTRAYLGGGYDVYLVVAHGDSTAGVAAVECRVEYNGTDQQGVDVFGWTLCADLQSSDAAWPDAGTSNRITWSSISACQRTVIGGEGVHAVAGAFYVFAYSPDVLSVVPPSTGFAVKDCRGTSSLIEQGVPKIAFSSSATVDGHNPCLDRCWNLVPTRIELGQVRVGEVRDSTVVIRNASGQTVSGRWTVSGGKYEILSADPRFQIEPGQSTSVPLRFAPQSWGGDTGYLWPHDSCNQAITLFATGMFGCAFEPNSVHFSPLAVGDAETLAVAVTNNMNTALAGSIQIAGSNFSLGQEADTVTLASGASTSIAVAFHPSRTGVCSGILTVDHACGAILLDGHGVVLCTATPEKLDLGEVKVGESGHAEFAVTNNRRTAISGQFTVDNPAFTVLDGETPFLVPPQSTSRYEVRFAPTINGMFRGTITVGSQCSTVEVSARGRDPSLRCTVLPGSDVDFGLIAVGLSKIGKIRYVNLSEQTFTLHLSAAELPDDFTLLDGEGPFTVPPGDTLAVRMRFAPRGLGTATGTLLADPPCAGVRVTGVGQAGPGRCVVETARFDFGDVLVGRSRTLETYFINLSGGTAHGSVYVPCTDFALAGATAYHLAVRDSQLVRLRFTPTALGTQACALDVTGDCGYPVIATGRGIAPPDTAQARPRIASVSRPADGVQRLAYEVLSAASVEIVILDVAGRRVARFNEGVRVAGHYELSWDARVRPGGIYFAHITAGRAEATARMLLLR